MGRQSFLRHGAAILDEIYLMDALFLKKWWAQQFKEKGRKSIPYTAIKKECIEIPIGYNPRIPYLNAVDKLIENFKDDKTENLY